LTRDLLLANGTHGELSGAQTLQQVSRAVLELVNRDDSLEDAVGGGPVVQETAANEQKHLALQRGRTGVFDALTRQAGRADHLP
jgi:hypothetical protein